MEHTIYAPGSLGQNSTESGVILGAEWATMTTGLIVHPTGLLCVKGPSDQQTTTGTTSQTTIRTVHTQVAADGTFSIISTTSTKLFASVTTLATGGAGDVTGALSPTAGYWNFVNFNGAVYGWQRSHTPIKRTTGNFAALSASGGGTLPDGDCAVAAFGRIWAADDDQQTLRWCDLLDDTTWEGALDMRNVWTAGTDRIIALAAVGANLIVFGRNHIVFFIDGSGSEVGLDPDKMYVVDVIEGTGCHARDTVCHVKGGDLWFMSPHGVQSLTRVVVSKDNPINTVSWQIDKTLSDGIQADLESITTIQDQRSYTACFIPESGQYFLFRRGSGGDAYIFHLTQEKQDRRGRNVIPVTVWPNLSAIFEQCHGMTAAPNSKVYYAGLSAGSEYHLFRYFPTENVDTSALSLEVNQDWEFETAFFVTDEMPMVRKQLKTASMSVTGVSVATAYQLRFRTDFSTDDDSTQRITSPALAASTTMHNYTFDTVGTQNEGQAFLLHLEMASSASSARGFQKLVSLQCNFVPLVGYNIRTGS